MLRNLYLTNQLTVEAMTSRSSNKVVMFIVNVKLVEKNENSHPGMVKVRNPISQNKNDGTIVKTPRSRPPSMLRVDLLTAASAAGAFRVMSGAMELSTSASFEAEAAALLLVPSILHVRRRKGCSAAKQSSQRRWPQCWLGSNQLRNVDHLRGGKSPGD
jgi:hypothetical protein